MTLTIDRRSFLDGLGVLSLIGLLDGCSGDDGQSDSIAPGSSDGGRVADALRALQQAVRSSPDHLAARADAVVGSGDADAIVRFVRDNIRVHPHRQNQGGAELDRRWGSEATLRSAAGTPRDRAELLAQLLTVAGVTATVMSAARPPEITVEALYRWSAVAFAPKEELVAKAAEAARAAGIALQEPATAAPGVSSVNAEVEEVASAILGALPAEAISQLVNRADLLPDRLPLVRYEAGGVTKYAFAVGELEPASSAPIDSRQLDPRAVAAKVTVTLQGLFNPPAGSRTPRAELVDLVTATWPLEQVIGRPISATFDALAPPATVLRSGLGATPNRVPSLRLQPRMPNQAGATATGGATIAEPADLNLAAHGTPISILGDVLTPVDSDPTQVSGPFGPLIALGADELEAARARARTVQVNANAAHFPDVTLEVTVADATGASVDGPVAASFVVSEQGAPAGAVLMSNGPDTRRPRVLVVYDGSVSIREAFPAEDARVAFNQTVARSIVAASAARPFDVQVISVGGTPSATDWLPPAEEKIVAAFEAFSFSEIWRSVATGGEVGGAAAMILISDMVSGDEPAKVAAFQARARTNGVPVICLPVGMADMAVVDQIIQLTGGDRLDPLAPDAGDQLTTLVGARLAQRVTTTYRLRYRAPAAGPDTRAVSVGIAGASMAAATTSYPVPPVDQRLAPTSVIGVYVTIDVDGVRDTRRIGGAKLGEGNRPSETLPDAAMAADAISVVNGLTTLVIEAAAPTAAAAADDVIAGHLTWEPLRPILPTGDVDAIAREAGGLRRYPGLLPVLFAPSVGLGQPDGTAPAASTSARDMTVVVIAVRPDPVQTASESLLTTTDISPLLNPVASWASDAQTAMGDAVRASLLLSAGEALVNEESAHASLLGRQLTYLPPGSSVPAAAIAALSTADAEIFRRTFDRYSGMHRLLPSGVLDAFWVIDPQTGTTVAIARDGSGGGAAQRVDLAQLYLALNLALLVAGLGCTLKGTDAAKGPAFYYTCVGLTVSSIFLTAAGVFPALGGTNGADGAYSFGAFAGVMGAATRGPRAALGARIGVALVVVILFLISQETNE